MNSFRFGLFTVCILVFAADANAITYYVRQSGDDTKAGTSVFNSFKTIKKAANVAKHNDIVYVGAGTYTDAVTVYGLGAGSYRVRFIADVSGARTGSAGPVLINAQVAVVNSNNVELNGFTFNGGATRYLVWQDSYEGLIANCSFANGDEGLLIKNASLEMDGCEIKDFAHDGIQVDGIAKMFVHDTTISGCGDSGIEVRKVAKLVLDTCTVSGNTGDGIQVAVTTDSIDIVPVGGASPNQMLVDALKLLQAMNPTAFTGKDRLGKASVVLNGSLNSSFWNDEWHLDLTNGMQFFEDAGELMLKLQELYDDPAGNGVTAKDQATLVKAIDLILTAYDVILEVSIDEAVAGGGAAEGIDDGILGRKYANDYWAVHKYRQSIGGFHKGWYYAKQAGGTGEGTLGGGSSSPSSPTDAITDGILDISGSSFNGNGCGVNLVTAQAFNTRYCDYSDNTEWGLRLSGASRVENCNINNNGIGGVSLKDINTSDLTVSKNTLADNVLYGVYAEGCGLEFTSTNFKEWAITGSQTAIAGKGSDIAFSGVTISGGSTAAVSIVDGNMKAASTKFTDSGYGLSVTNSNFALYDCTLSGNTVGLRADQNKSISVQNSKIHDNTEWGVQLSGRGSFTDTTISGNGIGGIELTDTTASELSLTRTSLTDNKTYGLYCIDSTLTFDTTTLGSATITGSETLFAGFESSLTFDGLTISGGSQYGIANFGGKVSINNCTLSGNGIGLYSDYGCAATKSTFSGNTTTGASVLNWATFTDCVFEKNANGLHISDDATGSVKLVGTTIQDNTLYGVWCDGCTLTFDATMQAGWNVQNNGANFGATGSTLTFNDFTISNGTTYGIVTENGTLNLTGSTLTANGTGAYIDANSALTASDTNFTSNTLYGVSARGKTTLQDCSFDDNTHGLHFANMTGGEVACSGTTVSNSTQSGLRLDSCTLALAGGGINGLTLSGNQYGIYGTNSTLAFDGFTSNSNTYGAWISSSDITMTNSTFTGSTYGLWATNNNSLSVDSSTFSGNGSYGVYVVGKVSLHNCSITGNGSGLYLNAANVTDAELSGTDISGNTVYGVYVYDGSLALSSQATDGWSIDGNGYNIGGYQADISLVGAELTDATNFGVFAEYGSLNLRQSTITSKSGGVWGFYTTGFTVDRSLISGSKTGSWGVVNLDGGLTMRNTIVSGAAYSVFSSDSSKPVTIYNSTLADASLYGLYVDSGDLTLMNTIISGSGGTYGLYRGATANLTHSYNLVSGFAVGFENTTADATELLASPRFVDAANGDFRLAVASPAINAGADLSAGGVTTDVLGNARPSHEAFEIGACEYMQAGGSLRVLSWKEDR